MRKGDQREVAEMLRRLLDAVERREKRPTLRGNDATYEGWGDVGRAGGTERGHPGSSAQDDT